jgi:hypothetical protein
MNTNTNTNTTILREDEKEIDFSVLNQQVLVTGIKEMNVSNQVEESIWVPVGPVININEIQPLKRLAAGRGKRSASAKSADDIILSVQCLEPVGNIEY